MRIADPRDVLISPVVSEKSYGLLDENKYTFIVAPDANKTQIKLAVEQVFGVKVTGVNTNNREGKRVREGMIEVVGINIAAVRRIKHQRDCIAAWIKALKNIGDGKVGNGEGPIVVKVPQPILMIVLRMKKKIHKHS